MEIKNTTSVSATGVATSKPPHDPVARRRPADRVSTLDVHRAADVARGVQAKVGELRTVRLAQIEDAIDSGNYQPSASQVANRMLDAAEIDSHMQAILGG
jgi:anti-sigma28 factor (negative regulator of flagellin synthesis)